MRCLFRASMLAAAALCATVGLAETSVGSLEPAAGTWRVYRGSTRVCSASSEATALACAAADAERRSSSTRYQIRYPNRYVTVTYSAPPPDTDGDGVPDSTDKCPTVRSVTADGCPASPSANRAPTISGTPATTGQVGVAYRFSPSASDADGDVLTFSISNQPRWATFSTTTGELVGAPTANDVGYHADITISVSDGRATTTLKEFPISVRAPTTPSEPAEPPPTGTGTATLSWTPPTQNEDGTALTNLAGYRISYGMSPTELTEPVQVAVPGATAYTIEDLSPGTWYFSVRAYTGDGTESAPSNVASKVVL